MRFVVCVKQVPDERSIETDPETGSLLRDTAGSIPNPDDAFALELARQTRDRLGSDVCRIDAMTMGPKQARSSLRQALSLGCDNAYHLIDRRFAGSDVYVTAKTLALTIENSGGADLVFCGEKSSDGDTGQVPAELSVHLNATYLPFVTEVIDIKSDYIVVRSRIDKQEYVIKSLLPAVVQVKTDSIKRIPASFRDRMRALDKPLKVMTADDLSSEDIFGYRCSPTRVRKMTAPVRTRSTMTYKGAKAIERFQSILSSINNETIQSASTDQNSQTHSRTEGQTPTQKPIIDEQAVVYLEASQAGCQNALELISHLQNLGVTTIRVLTIVSQSEAPTLSPRVSENTVDTLKSLTGEEDYESLVKNADTLMIVQSELKDVTVEECSFYLRDYLATDLAGLCLLSATDHGRSVGPLVAASLQTGITADVTDLQFVDGQWEQVRPAYGGQILATIVTPERRPVMATVRPKVFPIELHNDARGEVSVVLPKPHLKKTSIIATKSFERKTSLEEAKRLLIIGGAITTEAERDQLIAFARENDMEWGVTRALVQGYLAPHERQIGVSGVTVAPEWAILVGVSGSVQTMSGLRRAEKLVAINCDESAPVFENVDEALIGNWQDFIDLEINKR